MHPFVVFFYLGYGYINDKGHSYILIGSFLNLFVFYFLWRLHLVTVCLSPDNTSHILNFKGKLVCFDLKLVND